MSDIREILESANITHDTKARRVLNTAPDMTADITLSELESGVTIERLESLKVPVYQYGGQITIHGIFPDMTNDIRVNGYKSLLFNGNKSLGVKYVAIDSAKKKLLQESNHFRNKELYHWSIHIDSSGCEAWFISMDKNAIIEVYKNTPDNLYIGSKRAAALFPAGYAVIINIGAIYEVNLWQLINALTGIKNEAELNQFKEIERIKDESESAKYKAEREAAETKRQAEMIKARSEFKPPDNWKPFIGPITEAGMYAQIADSFSHGICLFVYKVKKHGKGYKISTRAFENFVFADWEAQQFKIWNTPKQIKNGWKIA